MSAQSPRVFALPEKVQNFFDLFGLKTDYFLDIADLQSRYRQLQKSVHPDRFVGAAAVERRVATQRAGMLNQAFQTLSSPLQRARHLLECSGVEVEDERVHSFAGSADAEFLLRQMELREKLRELRGAGDLEGLRSLYTQTEDEFSVLTRQFVEALHSEEREQGLQFFGKMQFVDKLLHELREMLHELGEN